MKICLVNFDSVWKDKAKNIEKKEEYIRKVLEHKKDTQFVIFPEESLTGYILDEDVYELAEKLDGPSIQRMQEIAKKYSIAVMFGFIEKNWDDKPYNSVVVIWKDGSIITSYRKNHLFTQSVEPDVYSAGAELSIFELEGWKCGLSICFDIRYPRLYEAYKKAWVECVFTSFAWVDWRNKPDIFNSLSKGRSSENQFFMASVDAIWKDQNNTYAWNAIVSNPYSENISETVDNIFHFADMDKQEITNLESIIPLSGGFKEEYSL